MSHLWRRILNTWRAECSVALSRLGIVRVRHLPTFVSVEPANICQLRCPECPVGNRHLRTSVPSRDEAPKYMSMDLFRHVLAQVESTAHTMQFYFQGEPLLNSALPEMIRLAHEQGLYTIVSTNVQALTDDMAEALCHSGLNRLIVSLDGLTPASYQSYRVGGSLDRALEGLRLIRRHREALHQSSPRIVLQMLRLRTNENEWSQIAQQYRTLGADKLEFKTAQLYDYEHGHPLMPSNPRYSRYRLGADGLYHPKRLAHRWLGMRSCRRLWTGCVITTCGDVLPCCYDKSGKYALGNILSDSLQSIYHGSRADAFRQMVLHHDNQVDICQNCDA